MNASDLITQKIPYLKTSLTGAEALVLMNDARVRHLPIVNNRQLLGIISEEDILAQDVNEPIGSYNLSLNRSYVKSKDHIFEVLQIMSNFKLSSIPVVDDKQEYLGSIVLEDILHVFAGSFSFTEPGSILVLEIPARDYSLADIARIIEQDNAKILSAFITRDLLKDQYSITLKISAQDNKRILASLERYDYNILASYTEEDFADTLKERYDSLIAYLNV